MKRIVSQAIVAASAAILIYACAPPNFEGDAVNGGSNATPTGEQNVTGCEPAPVLAPQDPSALPKCACAKGGAARCVAKSKLAAKLADRLDGCTDVTGGVCLPDSLVRSGAAAPTTCATAFGEGRCMNLCVPEVNANASLLNRGTHDECAPDERCIPCNNPLDNGNPTGVCEIGTTPPPSPDCAKKGGTDPNKSPSAPNVTCPYTGPPVVDVTTFDACGGGARCVPENLVPEAQRARLAKCAKGLCAPEKSIAAGGQYLPKACRSAALVEGRCLNINIPDIAAQKDSLPTNGCDVNERCAPCYNPLDGSDTSACRTVSCDAPKEAPTTISCPYTGPPVVDVRIYPSCGDGARCVPEAMVPTAQRSLLKRCATGLCSPEKSIAAAGQYLPKTCRSVANAEGRCLNVNIPSVEAQQASLPNTGCDASERCVPCFSPVDGSNTGACKSVSCDAPKEAGVRFADCCYDGGRPRGKCVPRSSVPADQRDKLESEDSHCRPNVDLCAPTENLDPSYVPPRCEGFNLLQLGDYTGVCISTCIPLDIFQELGTDQGDCRDGFTCAPCEVFGVPTGAPGCP